MASIVGFFKKLGSALKHVWKVVDKLVPDEQLIAGIEYVEQAAVQFVDKGLMRAWVLEQLMKRFGIPESIARLITELAVAQVKNGIHEGADKAEGAVAKP